MVDYPHKWLPFLELLSKLARRDVHARKIGKRYEPVNAPITKDDLLKHLASEISLGVYPLKGEATSVAVLDVDDKDAELGWEVVSKQSWAVFDALRKAGMKPHPFRSGGGNGIHIWLLWEEAQRAAAVRAFLKEIISRFGLSEGTSGLIDGTLEIYPRQDAVSPGRYGNLIALPLSRQSRPLLASTFDPVEVEE